MNMIHTQTHYLSLSYKHTYPQRHANLRRLSTSDMTTSATTSVLDSSLSDDLKNHILNSKPKENESSVPLSTSIVVHFDRDVRAVNINKLFEVHQESYILTSQQFQ